MICLKEVDVKSVTMGCCDAHFCAACLHRWLSKSTNSNCPHCRQVLTDKEAMDSCCKQTRDYVEDVLARLYGKEFDTLIDKIHVLEQRPRSVIPYVAMVLVVLILAVVSIQHVDIHDEVRFRCWNDRMDVCDHSKDPNSYTTEEEAYRANTFMYVRMVEPHVAMIEVYNGYPTPQLFMITSPEWGEGYQMAFSAHALRKSRPHKFSCAQQSITFTLHLESTHEEVHTFTFMPDEIQAPWI